MIQTAAEMPTRLTTLFWCWRRVLKLGAMSLLLSIGVLLALFRRWLFCVEEGRRQGEAAPPQINEDTTFATKRNIYIMFVCETRAALANGSHFRLTHNWLARTQPTHVVGQTIQVIRTPPTTPQHTLLHILQVEESITPHALLATCTAFATHYCFAGKVRPTGDGNVRMFI